MTFPHYEDKGKMHNGKKEKEIGEEGNESLIILAPMCFMCGFMRNLSDSFLVPFPYIRTLGAIKAK